MKNAENYKLTFEMREDYLYAHVECESMSLDLAKQYIKEIAEKCREVRAQCVIIDRHCPDSLSNAMSYLAISELCELAPPGFRMGIVDDDAENRRHLEFGLKSIEKSDVEVQIFANMKEAEVWLAAESVCS